MSEETNQDRRRFLGVGLGAAAASLAPGVVLYGVAQAKTDSEPASNKVRWGMLVDTTKCADNCDKCVSACATENGWDKHTGRAETRPQWMRKVTLKDKVTRRTTSLPMMCQHCEKPPCVDVCPTNASMKREDGIVLVDKHRCIGCRYCMMACPYKARSFVHEQVTDQKSYMPRGMGTVESCTFCVHRIDKGESPACVEACPEKAIVFGDMNNANSEISHRLRLFSTTQIRDDLRLNLGVRYEGI
ncbi:MAG: 4Fe-4S dicluster domain-containing protein [Gammaproteobacteria bacterium]|nr:4Fe-4S dicluster domain-containing protein [Gammaproteobacteria bacterium]